MSTTTADDDRIGVGGKVLKKRTHIQRKCSCIFCGRVYSDPRYLNDHLHAHIGERPYPCDKCDLWFKTFSTHWDHRRVVHDGVKWICEFCLQEFQALSNLCAHKRRVHPIEQKAAKEKKLRDKGQQQKPTTSSEEKLIAVQKQKISVKKKVPKFVVKVNLSKKIKTTKLQTITNSTPSTHCNCPICGKILRKGSIKKHIATRHSTNDGKGNNISSTASNGEVNRTARTTDETIPINQNTQCYAQTFSDSGNNGNSLQKPPFPFKPHNAPVVARNKWDASFFLHMNRYNVEDSCFYDPTTSKPTITPERPKANAKIIKKEIHVVKNKTKIISKIPKLGITKTKKFKNLSTVKVTVKPDEAHTMNQLQESHKIPTEIKVEVLEKDDKKEIRTDDIASTGFTCQKCGKTLANKYSFQNHQNIPDCLRLKQMRDIRTDLSLAYTCHFCKRNFGGYRSNLIRHIVSLHCYKEEEEEEKDNESKPGGPRQRTEYTDYSCGFCGETYEYKEDLQDHILISHFEMLGIPRESVQQLT